MRLTDATQRKMLVLRDLFSVLALGLQIGPSTQIPSTRVRCGLLPPTIVAYLVVYMSCTMTQIKTSLAALLPRFCSLSPLALVLCKVTSVALSYLRSSLLFIPLIFPVVNRECTHCMPLPRSLLTTAFAIAHSTASTHSQSPIGAESCAGSVSPCKVTRRTAGEANSPSDSNNMPPSCLLSPPSRYPPIRLPLYVLCPHIYWCQAFAPPPFMPGLLACFPCSLSRSFTPSFQLRTRAAMVALVIC